MEDWERMFAALSLGDGGGVLETPVRRSGPAAALGLARRGEARFRSASPALSLLNGEQPPQSPHFADISAWDLAEYRRTVRQYRVSRGSGSGGSGSGSELAVPGLLGNEMPPQSPLFADVPRRDIEGYRETIRKAKLARRNTMAAQRSAHQPPMAADPVYASLRKTSVAVERHSLAGALAYPGSPSPAGSTVDGWWTEPVDDDWIMSQEPPRSPLFADYHSERAEQRLRAASDVRSSCSSKLLKAVGDAVAADLVRPGEIGELDGDHERWFQVDVHSLFASPFSTKSEPRVTVREVSGYDQASAPLVAVDADDPDVLAALERYLTLLSRKAAGPAGGRSNQRRQRQRPTSMRVPSYSKLPPDIIDFHIPALSFMVRSKTAAGRARAATDRRVRAVDLEAMVEAYLPHVYAELDTAAAVSSAVLSPLSADSRGMFTRSPSESSVATLAEPPSPPVVAAPGADDRQQRHAKIAPPKRLATPLMCRALSCDGAFGSVHEPSAVGRPPLRAAVSTLNLKGALYPTTPTPVRAPVPLRARVHSPMGAAGLDAKSRAVSPRSSVLSAASSRTSGVTEIGADPGLGRQPMDQQRASMRSRKDLAPLAIPRLAMDAGSRTARPTLASSPVADGGQRRRGISTGTQAAAPSVGRATARASFAGAAPPVQSLERRPRTAPLRYSQPDMTPTRLPAPAMHVAARRPDVRQLFAMAQTAAAASADRRNPPPPPPPVQDVAERSAVRQRFGAKLMEFRSRIFPQ